MNLFLQNRLTAILFVVSIYKITDFYLNPLKRKPQNF